MHDGVSKHFRKTFRRHFGGGNSFQRLGDFREGLGSCNVARLDVGSEVEWVTDVSEFWGEIMGIVLILTISGLRIFRRETLLISPQGSKLVVSYFNGKSNICNK